MTTPAFTADLGPVWWVQVFNPAEAMVFDSNWLQQHYGPERVDEHDALLTDANSNLEVAMSAKPECLCDGSGTYTVDIPIADAVVSHQLPCPAHNPDAPKRRLLVRDTSRNGRLGEVMHWQTLRGVDRVDLRPPGGGREWTTDADVLEVVNPDEVLATTTAPELGV